MTDYHYFSLSDTLTDSRKSLNDDHLVLNTTNNTNHDDNNVHLNITYTAFEILVGIVAVIGNLMVIIVFKRDRKLRRRTNYYIVSLAVADFLVGLFGVPFAILTSMGQPEQKHACLLSLSTLCTLCTISIFCLVAVSVDRYWAILYPMAYSRTVRTKTAIGMISICWVAGTIFGLIPLFGVHQKYNDSCFFEKVMDYNYLLVLYFATIITPALLLLAFYAHIYRVIVRQIRQIVTMNPIGECSRRSSSSVHAIHHQTSTTISSATLNRNHHGGMLRVLGAARKRDVKATQNLSIIVLFFMFCWIPLYTINCITAFNPSIKISDEFKMCCIIITHLNSAVNPILYAYHLKDFRAALKNLLLKIFGFENDPPQEIAYRLSLASQHRLQSVNNNDKRSSIQNRIYIDSPIWLRQQQQLQSKKQPAHSSSAISCSLNSVHHTVAAVATATTDINRGIWKIVEVSSSSHDDNNIQNNHCKKISTGSYHKNSQIEERNGQISYENTNLTSNDYNDDDDVFLPKVRKNSKLSLASLIRDKLHPPEHDHYELNILKLNNEESKERYISNFNNYLSPLASSLIGNEKLIQNDCKIDRQYIENTEENPILTIQKNDNEIKKNNSIYHIETTRQEIPSSQLLKCKIINSPIIETRKQHINNIHDEIHHRRSVSCNNNLTESIIYKSDQFQKNNNSDNNINNSLDKFNSIKIVNNLIYPRTKHSNSLFHIYDNDHVTNNENDYQNFQLSRKRTTSAEN